MRLNEKENKIFEEIVDDLKKQNNEIINEDKVGLVMQTNQKNKNNNIRQYI